MKQLVHLSMARLLSKRSIQLLPRQSLRLRSAQQATNRNSSQPITLALLVLSLLLFSLSASAQTTITSVVYFDGNNDGAYTSSKEVGFGGVTVKAYDATNTVKSTATTNLTGGLGGYTLSGLTSGTTYRIEFTLPSGYNDGAKGSKSSTSIQFVKPGSTADLGVYVPGVCDPDKTVRVVAGCAAVNGSIVSVASWDYTADRKTTVEDEEVNPHADDIKDNTKSGIPMGMGARAKDKLMFFSTVSAPETTIYPPAPDGKSAIYVADYSGAGNTYKGFKLLTKLSSINVTNQFPIAGGGNNIGELGLGGLDLTEDGKTLYVVNMGKGTIVKVDISSVVYASIPAGGYPSLTTSEIAMPAGASCTGGRFRPSALEVYGGSLYLGGVCDAATSTNANVRLKILKMNLTTNAWTTILDYAMSGNKGGTLRETGWPNVKWSNSFTGDESSAGEIQPFVNDIAIDDYGSVIIGISNRKVFSTETKRDMGYMLRTFRKADGTMAMESAGKAGPLTSAAKTSPSKSPGLNDNDLPMLADGPGGDWFLEIGRTTSHPYLHTGGVYILPGTKELVAGFSDPLDGNGNAGARYIGYDDGVTTGGISLTDAKAFALTGAESVCEVSSLEIGNLVWKDLNSDGRQDPNEPGIAGVTVSLKSSTGTLITTAVTDANGNYIFSNATGTSTANFKYGVNLQPLTTYKVTVDNPTGQTPLKGLSLTTKDLTTNTEDLRDSDAGLVGSNAEIAVTTGAAGANNHSFDIGFNAATCLMDITVQRGNCDPATNKYSITGTVNFTTVSPGTMTISDGTKTTTVVVAAGATSANFTLTGLASDGATHTVIATLAGCATDNATYQAPPSCAQPGVCSITIDANPLDCDPSTNKYDVTGTLTLVNATAGGNATITDGTITTTVTIAPGATSVPFTLAGLTSNGAQHTISVDLPGCDTDNTTYNAPNSCTPPPPACTIGVSATRGECVQATNLYTVTGTITLSNAVAGTATITDGTIATTITIKATDTDVPFTLPGLTSDGTVHTLTVTLPGCGSDDAQYTAPVSCACPSPNCFPTTISKN
ncbi:SdrD B-like domain-containing protein [Spirosoma fluviale]|uniref:SdrD B-like domain n=1 Tax=Spirosoma fluviale TaxID=1597977 RepID=A0A286G599_9BACT|nr:SdrD B-like domain-containing protein [Spirosoma fluviale]SOD90678.1 SdrD B-like domain [Spirosoma fluviale]